MEARASAIGCSTITRRDSATLHRLPRAQKLPLFSCQSSPRGAVIVCVRVSLDGCVREPSWKQTKTGETSLFTQGIQSPWATAHRFSSYHSWQRMDASNDPALLLLPRYKLRGGFFMCQRFHGVIPRSPTQTRAQAAVAMGPPGVTPSPGLSSSRSNPPASEESLHPPPSSQIVVGSRDEILNPGEELVSEILPVRWG